MNFDTGVYLLATGAVVLAEMGDKTQLLAMALATRFKFWTVMLGVLIATLLNHALAVAVGTLVTQIEGLQTIISTLAALAFIFFGLWTVRGDKLHGEEKRTSKLGPLVTVMIAFFIAELGDKTQLMTIAISTQHPTQFVAVLSGTTTGMLIADAIGIAAGALLYKFIPERTVKLISAGAFVVFGFISFYGTAMDETLLNLGLPMTLICMSTLAAVTVLVAQRLLKNENKA